MLRPLVALLEKGKDQHKKVDLGACRTSNFVRHEVSGHLSPRDGGLVAACRFRTLTLYDRGRFTPKQINSSQGAHPAITNQDKKHLLMLASLPFSPRLPCSQVQLGDARLDA